MEPNQLAVARSNPFQRILSRTLSAAALLLTIVFLSACSGGNSVGNTASPPTGGGNSVDSTAPFISIASPTAASSYDNGSSASLASLSGTASDAVGVTQVSWVNNQGGSGTASLSGPVTSRTWSASNIALQNGTNLITVTARDAAGNSSTDTLSVTYTAVSGGDTTPPVVTITAPTSSSSYNNGSSSTLATLSGTASDAVGVTQVSWANNQGGSGTATLSGAVTSGTWSVLNIALQNGTNLITVTARDAAGNFATDTLSVSYTASAGSTTTYYVAQTASASDNNNGTSLSTPFRTINKAINAVGPGNTIEIRAGTYTENNLLITTPGTSTAGIIMRAYNNEQVLIKSTGAGPTIYFYHNNCDETVIGNGSGNTDCQAFYWTVQGLEIQGSPNGGGDGNAVKIDTPRVTLTGNKLCCAKADVVKLVRTSNFVSILNNDISQNTAIFTPDANAQGVDIVGADDVRVANNYVHDIDDIGIYTKGNARRNIFENNRLENIGLRSGANALMLGQSTDAFRLVDGLYETYDGIIRNNIVRNTGGPCLATASSYNVRIYNNSCYNTGQLTHGSILISNESERAQPGTNIDIKNNIIYGSASNSIIKISNFMGAALTDNTTLNIDKNLYWVVGAAPTFSWDANFTGISFSQWLTNYTTLTGHIDTSRVLDPKYSDLVTLALQPISPAINAGIDTPYAITDYTGIARPQGSVTDIGAYEY